MSTILAKDIEKFKKLGIYTLAELAVIAPARYEDRMLYETLHEEKEQAIDATVEAVRQSPRSAVIALYVHNFGHRIEGVFFNPRPFMLRPFVVGERGIFFGRISCKQGHCQMHHPQPISESGTITPRYKTKLRTDVMARLVQHYLRADTLRAEGLPADVVAALLSVHFPTRVPPREFTPEQRRALKYTELFTYMRALRNKRRDFTAIAPLRGEWRAWAMRLPFVLTDEQIAAIEAIERDLERDVSAKRMIVGDVGSGKTMVILAAALIARPHRAVLMAPTTLLAQQLYEEAQKFLSDLAITLVTNASKKPIPDSVDLMIGTHALLYRELPEAALVMVDEQHRFGTAQRHRLEKMLSQGSCRPHYLQFSATPIPRTQAMIDSAHIDVSLITKTPFKKDITSRVIRKPDFRELMAHIRDEIAQQHQVLLVYPLVDQSEALAYQSLEEARAFWESRFEGVYVTHGKDKGKEKVLQCFRDEGSILLATTVVEVGISLPRLSTVVIVGAERLGLATLHQLRGRVSRTGLKGYCFLYTNAETSPRLDAFITTDNGFDIAALDLQFRQSGDLLTGSMQSGKKFQWFDMGEDDAIAREVRAAL